MTQQQLADRVPMPLSTLAEAETKGKRAGSYTAQIALACGVSQIWLATGAGEMIDAPLAAAALTRNSAAASLDGTPPAISAITTSMRTIFSAIGALEGFKLSQAQNALRYATENPLEWQAAALTLEQLLAAIGEPTGSGKTGTATGKAKFTKKPAHSFLPTKEQGKGAKER
ncbi:helix-turn-helix domain-containing protein [Variovorax paradoxus]|nr:helix-turn-helix domain-containing protein [Variovorax paradoxus]